LGWAVAIGVLVGMPARSEAQSTTSTELQRVVEGLDTGTVVRIDLGTRIEEGLLVGATSAGLAWNEPAGEARVVPLEAVRALSMRQSAIRRGLKIGAVTGALSGLLYGLFLVWQLCPDSCSGADAYLAPPMLSLVFGGVGAFVGAGVGSAVREWHEVYARPVAP